MAFTFQIVSSASQDRLERLIAERLKPDADKARIDQRVWDLFGERWAVMFTDLSGFSRRVVEFGIIHFLQTIYESQRVLVPIIEARGGILLKVEGDSMLVIFRNVTEAITCAISMQQSVKHYNESRSDAEKILLCIGIGYGDMLRIGDSDVFGAEVNAASKLGEDAAKAWEIIVTGPVRRAANLPPDVTFEPTDYVPSGADSAFKIKYPI